MAERRGQHGLGTRTAAFLLCLALPLAGAPRAGVYVTETSGIRWNDVGGIRWNDVGGIRWNDVGGIDFAGALTTGETSVDLGLLNSLSGLPDTSSINVIVTYRAAPTASDLTNLTALRSEER